MLPLMLLLVLLLLVRKSKFLSVDDVVSIKGYHIVWKRLVLLRGVEDSTVVETVIDDDVSVCGSVDDFDGNEVIVIFL